MIVQHYCCNCCIGISLLLTGTLKPYLYFQVVLPFFVATKMSKIRKGSVFAPSPGTFVRSALNTVGMQARTFGFWSHAVQVSYRLFVPSGLW